MYKLITNKIPTIDPRTLSIQSAQVRDLNSYLSTWIQALPASSANSVPTTNLVTDLSTRTVTTPAIVYAQGYYAPGDGGGGYFQYDSADTTTSADGATVFVSGTRRWKRVMDGKRLCPLWFGARGDYVYGMTSLHDDTAAIQACVTYAFVHFDNGGPTKYKTNLSTGNKKFSPSMGGSIIDFAGRTYMVTASITTPAGYGGSGLTYQNGYVVAGVGFVNTGLSTAYTDRQHGRGVFEVIYNQAVAQSAYLEDIHFYNMNIDASSVADFGIRVGSINNSSIRYCKIFGFNLAGIYGDHYNGGGFGGDDINIQHNNIWQYDLGFPAGGFFGGNVFGTNGGYYPNVITGYGIWLDSNDSNITNNIIINCKIGIKLGSLHYNATTGLVDMSGWGTQAGGNTTVSNNHIWNCELCLWSAGGVTIHTNYFDQCGIEVYGASFSVITGNIFSPGLNSASVTIYPGSNSLQHFTMVGNHIAGANIAQSSTNTLGISPAGAAVGDTINLTFPDWTNKRPDMRWAHGLQFYETSGGSGLGFFSSITPADPAADNTWPGTAYTATAIVLRPFTNTTLTPGNWGMVSGNISIHPTVAPTDTVTVTNNNRPILGGISNNFWTDYGVSGLDNSVFPPTAFFQSLGNSVKLSMEAGGCRITSGANTLASIKTGGIALGASASALGTGAIAIGASASAAASGAIAIDASVSNTTANSIRIGTPAVLTAIGGHLHSFTSGIPTAVAGAGAGTSPTVTIAGSDTTGSVTILAGTTPTAGLTTLVTLTFSSAYVSTPKSVLIVPANGNAAGIAKPAYASSTSTNASSTVINIPAGAVLTAGTSYMWYYFVMG